MQASDEEVEKIAELTRGLIGRRFYNGDKIRVLGAEDILYVAPYNFQVGKLKAALGQDARVGSVDRFQGQEAPVVIMSMCASSGEDVTRGLEFLMSKNRLNVALSRAQALAIVVGNSALGRAHVTSVEQMALVNFFCRLLEYERAPANIAEPKKKAL